MPRYDNKLSRFEDAIMKRANQQRDSIIKEIESLQASEVRTAEEGFLQEEARRVKGELSQLGEDFNRKLAQKTAEYRREVLKRRDEMAESVFAGTRQKLLDFAGSGRPYTDWMVKRLQAMRGICPESGCMLFIMERDRPLTDELCAAYGGDCQVTVSEDFGIGGIILFHPATGLIVDESLDAALADQRDYFLEHSGLVEPLGPVTR